MGDGTELETLIAELSRSDAFPARTAPVVVEQTHISVVFLVGDDVYKLKKPVKLDFLDFSTLALRRHFCEAEVRLNKRLAPDVYRGVLPVTRADGRVRVDGTGEVVDYVVWMRRLPASATLLTRVRNGEVELSLIDRVARRVAEFHVGGQRSKAIAEGGRFAAVEDSCLAILDQSEGHVGAIVTRSVHRRVRRAIAANLAELRPLIERRAAESLPVDSHGDLHLDHVYYFPEKAPPADLVIIDCIEFAEGLRHIDPIADLAFLSMDLAFHGRDDLRHRLNAVYLQTTGDPDGGRLLPLYTAYRSTVRAMVHGMTALAHEVTADGAAAAAARARAHWLFTLGELEPAGNRPCMVLLSGLPGTGKSTLAYALREDHGFASVRSDAVRKEIAASSGVVAKYSPEWSDRTYATCLERAVSIVEDGGRVVVDANFRTADRRRPFMAAARALCVPCVLFVLRASSTECKARLAGRRGDVSDADAQIYDSVALEWEEPSETTAIVRDVATGDGIDAMVHATLTPLRELGLVD